MQDDNALASFRSETSDWVKAHFPDELRGIEIGIEGVGGDEHAAPLERWRLALGERGYGAPTWPVAYGGAGLSDPQAKVLGQVLYQHGAFNPIPVLAGMGITMVGPTLLEYGTDAQKEKHLPRIARGDVRWCLGLSEPNAGSDLASLNTRAEAQGDEYVINGQKIWTSGADQSQWCGALVRTDPKAAKRDGISFLMLPMDQPGVETRPIRLISGASPFCETYFNDARAAKTDLLGELNDGWSVIKRLLQHERQSQTRSGRTPTDEQASLQELAREYVGTDEHGQLTDVDLRQRIVRHLMDGEAHSLTIGRITAEARGKVEVSAVASILKNSNTRVAQEKAELTLEIMGNQGLGQGGELFSEAEQAATADWLWGKAMSIYGGSYEVQNNIIAKNILGLPETTQKG